jgi:N-dimethylarginine dimethylaminohydrolase
MHIDNQVFQQKAQAAYQELKSIYQKLGVQIFELEPQEDLPDLVYTANCGEVCKDVFVKANFKFPERRRETEVTEEYFAKQFNFKPFTLPTEIFFEGQGDLLHTSKNYFLGWGKRTMPEAKHYLQEVLNKPIIDLELVDPYYYHLDTCFSPLSDTSVIINPSSFTEQGLSVIHNNFSDVIEPTIEDHAILACNLVKIDNNIIVAKGISDNLRTQFEQRNLIIHEVDTEEFRKGGGSIKCLSFEF